MGKLCAWPTAKVRREKIEFVEKYPFGIAFLAFRCYEPKAGSLRFATIPGDPRHVAGNRWTWRPGEAPAVIREQKNQRTATNLSEDSQYLARLRLLDTPHLNSVRLCICVLSSLFPRPSINLESTFAADHSHLDSVISRDVHVIQRLTSHCKKRRLFVYFIRRTSSARNTMVCWGS